MKKKSILLGLIPLAIPLLSGCAEPSPIPLTYGTYVTQSVETLTVLDNDELYTKMFEAKETFILAIYQGAYSDDCLCWNTFKNTIVSYINKYHEMIYLFDAQQMDERFENRYSFFKKKEDSSPILVTISQSSPIRCYTYNSYFVQELFSDVDALYKAIREAMITKPLTYLVDDDYLKDKLPKTNKSIVLFMRRGCADCNYALPNVVLPYLKKNKTSKEFLVFDMQDAYNLSKKEGATEQEKAYYQGLKDYYGLSASSNATYGYQEGVVPTIAYYEKGVMKDAAVFFNDIVEKKEDGKYYISDSFYSEERVKNLKYLKNSQIEPAYLTGYGVNANEVIDGGNEKYYWKQDVAASYHTAYFEQFLEYYLG